MRMARRRRRSTLPANPLGISAIKRILRYLVIRENVGRMYSQLVSWVDSMATLRLSLTVCGIPSTWGGSVWMTRHSYKALIQRFRLAGLPIQALGEKTLDAALDPALYAKTLIGVDGVPS
jgi:hypothetical protein